MAHQRAHWTPNLRDEWINYSVSSPIGTDCDNLDGYMFLHMEKPSSNMDEYERCDLYRSFATYCLSQAVYESYPIHKRISLCFYETLMSRIDKNSFLALMLKKGHFMVLINGNNAHKMLLTHFPETQGIDYTDLDITMYINPNLDEDLFEKIKQSLVILTSQVMSRYKKDLDALLFLNGGDSGADECILDKSSAEEFKEYYTSLITSYDEEEEEGYDMLSPFQSDKIRNLCSEKSYMTLDSEIDADYVVCVEVPHLPMCEFIPLQKTPFVLSYNNSIMYDRDVEGKYLAHYNTFKLQLNNMLVPYTISETTTDPEIVWEEIASQDNDTDTVYTLTYCKTPSPKIYDHDSRMIVPSNFLIVSIPCQDDAQLLDFWKRRGYNNKCREIYDDSIHYPMLVPNVNECIRELTNTLNVYTNRHTLDEEIQQRITDLTALLHNIQIK